MSCLATVAILVVVVLVVIHWSAKANERARQGRLYSALARRFSGVYIGGGWTSAPTIRFRYGATQAVVQIYQGAKREHDQTVAISIDWAESELWCEIISPRETIGDSPFRTVQAFETDDPDFNHRFLVRATRVSEGKKLLSRGVQWQLEELRRMATPANVYVEIGHGRLRVRRPFHQVRMPDLECFIRRSLELYDQAMLTRAVGIEFVESEEAKLIIEAKCQVCGEDVVDDMVICRRCKTPHHRDCWLYFGSCSTYGCQESHFTVPASAEAVAPPRDSSEPSP
ncbi:MAG: RING finger protein [Pirellulaceae bacterium]